MRKKAAYAGPIFVLHHSSTRLNLIAMPKSCHEFLRLMILDSLFTGPKKKWTKAELLEKVNTNLQSQTGRSNTAIAMRTLELDIQKMRHGTLQVHAPIVYRNGFYSYSDPEFSLRSSMLPLELIRHLRKLGKSLPQLLGSRELPLEIQEVIIDALESLARLLGEHPEIRLTPDWSQWEVNHSILNLPAKDISLDERLVDVEKIGPLACPSFNDDLIEIEVKQASESPPLRPTRWMARPSRRARIRPIAEPKRAMKWGDLFALMERIDWKRQAA